jgi:hypothetical protein
MIAGIGLWGVVHQDDLGEKHSTLITFENQAENTTTGDIYVMDGGQWDLIPVTIYANGSTTVKATWYGDHETVAVFAVFDYDGYETMFRYELREKEHRTVVLI